uniref:Neurotransmitter-gated ion-channel ligand-binding domain-containing protein n=1 Tax=Anopheles quadriannulatus TaxID=34691 RepID=A0A182X600_ANOQN
MKCNYVRNPHTNGRPEGGSEMCMAGYNEKRLLHDLLDSYNILERPVVNESDPLQLSFGLTLMQIIDVH